MSKLDFNKGWEVRSLTRNEKEGKSIDLPHDAMLSEERSSNAEGGVNVAWFLGGDYVYAKRFELSVPEGGKAILEFEGVYRNAKVFLNGEKVGENDYGYNCFYVDLTPSLKHGENLLEVYAYNADQPNSRWYSGSGIYRPVWLHVLPREYIIRDSVRIETLEYQSGKLSIRGNASYDGPLEISLTDREGNEVGHFELESKRGNFSVITNIVGAHLWDEHDPYLYTATFIANGKEKLSIRFGVRQIEFSPKGFFINGKRLLLKGACIHHDNGILGAATYSDCEKRKVEWLVKAGYNAIRSAHNPISKAMLDACDELGVYVMDEYVDCWYIHKTKYDYVNNLMANYPTDLRLMVEKDYNHPCVVMYSVGNEVAETSQEKGIALVEDFVHIISETDPTRPVTCGVNIFFNALFSLGFGIYSDKKAESNSQAKAKKKESGSAFFNKITNYLGSNVMKVGSTLHLCDKKTRGAFEKLDVAGYNYALNRYKHDMKKYPNRLIVGSETFCCDTALWLKIAKENPRLVGDFVWSGIDYLGECGIGSWVNEEDAPSFDHGAGWTAAGSGRIDITGRFLGEALFTEVIYGKKDIAMAVIAPKEYRLKHSPSAWKFSLAMPHYDFPDEEIGKKVGVEVYSLAPMVELMLNGVSLGKKKSKKNGRTVFTFPYAKGELVALGYDSEGKEIARTSLRTSDKPTALTLHSEYERPTPNDHLVFVRMALENGDGDIRVYEKDSLRVHDVKGGKLLGIGNGCPYHEESYLGDHCLTYLGEALAIFQVDGENDFGFVVSSDRHGDAHFSL